MSEYIVRWMTAPGRMAHEKVVSATSPQDAAEKAVDRHPLPSGATAVEVSVYERVLSRHDVIVGDEDDKNQNATESFAGP